MDNALNKETLKEKEIQRIFENLEDEIALIAASAKLDFNMQKTTEKELELKLAYIADTKNMVKILKNRMSLLWKTTS